MDKYTLVIMAAGIGSRFGKGIKQLTSFGPSGEIIMDYSIHDALEAGFNKVVFVIRKSMYEDFRMIVGDRISRRVETAYAFQELEDLPEGFSLPEGRTKPWGTGQAILACRDVVSEPFAVINADDYYGKDAFRKVLAFLKQTHTEISGEARKAAGKYHFCMAGFVLKNTLSEHGGVTRGICKVDQSGVLLSIKETKNIIKTREGAAVEQPDGTLTPVDENALVSMNFWGYSPDFFDELDRGFREFLHDLGDHAATAEYLLPTIADRLLKEGRVDLSVLPSKDRWFGVTFQNDIPVVREAFAELVSSGVYPSNLYA